jgi:hypothetical protein
VSGLVGGIHTLQAEFPLVTPASSVTPRSTVSDTPIGHNHTHGRATRVNENIAAAETARQGLATMAGAGRRRRTLPRRVRYVTGRLADDDSFPLMRLRYGGSATRWGFAIYLASKDGDQDSALPTG